MITTHTMPTGDIRTIRAKVEHYAADTNEEGWLAFYDYVTDLYSDNIISLNIDRQGNSKFFGYGVSQKLTYKRRGFIDTSIDKQKAFKVSFGDGSEEGWACAFPLFYPDSFTYDENKDETTITAYDGLHNATKHTVSELDVDVTIWDNATILSSCAKLLKCRTDEYSLVGYDWDLFNLYIYTGGSFDGTETIRELLDAIAEYWGMIYYIDSENRLTFRALDRDGASLYTIDKSQYFTLTNSGEKTLASICKVTELGDNVIASAEGVKGETQFIRDNPYLEVTQFTTEILNNLIENIGGIAINQVNCKWRGNYLLEIGDKLSFENITSYLLNDAISYTGGFSQVTQWSFAEESPVTANPVNLGDAIRKTFAQVDKANEQIELSVADITQLKLTTSEISGTVERVEQMTNDVNGEIVTLTEKVDAAITADDVKLTIQNELANGVEKVTTTTGFTFDDVGLTITKSTSDITTQITEDGMRVYRGSVTRDVDDDNAVLVANSQGVRAENLKATTYLIINQTSRFEDWDGRTACFWIGG